MSVSVVIALGGNLGDVQAIGEVALSQLNETPGLEVQRSSRWYSTEPVGCEGRFLNSAALLLSELTPLQLLDRLQEIETSLGRVRTGRWTPRTLDLDIVLFGSWQVDHSRLIVPHPAAWHRRFVLDPACEIASEMGHPALGLTLGQLRERLLPRPLLASGCGERPHPGITNAAVQARFGSRVRWVGEDEPGIVRFVPTPSAPLGPFQVALSSDPGEARRIVTETLTALLDEPVVQP